MAKGPAEATQTKKPEGAGAPAQTTHKPDPQPTGKKGHTVAPGGCHAVGCKSPETRFNFCNEHYDHFKFGLIKKTGERVPDFERKYEHFLAHQRSPQRSSLKKVA